MEEIHKWKLTTWKCSISGLYVRLTVEPGFVEEFDHLGGLIPFIKVNELEWGTQARANLLSKIAAYLQGVDYWLAD